MGPCCIRFEPLRLLCVDTWFLMLYMPILCQYSDVLKPEAESDNLILKKYDLFYRSRYFSPFSLIIIPEIAMFYTEKRKEK